MIDSEEEMQRRLEASSECGAQIKPKQNLEKSNCDKG